MNGETEVRRVRGLRRFQARLLMAWSIGSILIGLPAWFFMPNHVFVNACGSQFFIWGAIDAVFAYLGLRQAARAGRTPIDENFIQIELADRDKLLKFLRFNTILNYIWVGIGLLLLAAGFFSTTTPPCSGTAWASPCREGICLRGIGGLNGG